MAETLKARSGSSLKVRFQYRNPDGTLIDTSGLTARISVRALSSSGRIILESNESAVADSVLELIEPGHWRFFLSAAVTKILPPTVLWEMELVSNTNPDDISTLAFGSIVVTPEKVKNFEL